MQSLQIILGYTLNKRRLFTVQSFERRNVTNNLNE